MSQYRMRLVWFFKFPDFFCGQFDRCCRDSFIQLVQFGGADNRRCHSLVKQPLHKRPGHLTIPVHWLFSSGYSRRQNQRRNKKPAVPFHRFWLLRSRNCFWMRLYRPFSVSGQKSPCQRAPGDQTDSLILAKRDHFPFFFPVSEIVMILHRDETRPVTFLRDLLVPWQIAMPTCWKRRYNEPCRIEPDRLTLPSFLQSVWHCPSDGSGTGRCNPYSGASMKRQPRRKYVFWTDRWCSAECFLNWAEAASAPISSET